MKCEKCGVKMIDAGKVETEGMSFISEVNGRTVALQSVDGKPDVLMCPKCGRVCLYHKKT